MECGNCHSYYPQSNLVSQSPKVVVSYGRNLDTQKRRIVLNLSVVSCNLICCYCDTETQRLDKNMQSDNDVVLHVSSEEYIRFCFEYKDICDKLNIGHGKDGFGNTSAFTNHQYNYYFINTTDNHSNNTHILHHIIITTTTYDHNLYNNKYKQQNQKQIIFYHNKIN